MTNTTVLIVEDEANIRRFVRIALEQEGMSVVEVDSGQKARADAATRHPDVIIIDLGLPDCDGKDLIRELRTWVTSPILVLSARDDEAEKVQALDAGADDYLSKPFGVPELLARLRALIRRGLGPISSTGHSVVASFGPVTVNLASHEVTRHGQPVHLTPIQFRLLAALVAGQGKVLTHRHLLLETWGIGYADRAHYLRVYMMQLRQKLEDDATQPRYLLTELQVGYRLAGLRPDTLGASKNVAEY